MRITYNAPVTLTFAFFAILVLFADSQLAPSLIQNVFTAEGKHTFDVLNKAAYLRLFTYIFGHVDIHHLTSNMMFILLLGPSLEERYSSGSIALMIFVTALLNGLVNAFFFHTMLVGASGIVFMMIVLTSFANVKRGEVPLSFFLVASMYVWMEIMRAKLEGDVSYFAHLLGGICGAIFGFFENSFSRRNSV